MDALGSCQGDLVPVHTCLDHKYCFPERLGEFKVAVIAIPNDGRRIAAIALSVGGQCWQPTLIPDHFALFANADPTEGDIHLTYGAQHLSLHCLNVPRKLLSYCLIN